MYHIEKKLFVSQRGGFISCDKIKYQLCEISISLLKKQLYFRISVGFRRCIVGNFSLTNSDNTFDIPCHSSSVATKQALDIFKESLIPDVPVELSAAPVTLTDKLYFFVTRASSLKLSLCEVSFRTPYWKQKRNR